MRLAEMPLWQRLANPKSAQAELSALRHTLSTQPLFNQQLQEWLHAEYLTTHAYARVEGNPHAKREYLLYANALAELAGKLFREETPSTTTEAHRKI